MKKANEEYRNKIIENATEEFKSIAGIKDMHGMHSTVYCFITSLLDLGGYLKSLERFERSFPDTKEDEE